MQQEARKIAVLLTCDSGKTKDHCIEALRMKIMCEADVGVILYQEQPGDDGKFEPDYQTQHVCRNWDKVREWAVSNKVADKATF